MYHERFPPDIILSFLPLPVPTLSALPTYLPYITSFYSPPNWPSVARRAARDRRRRRRHFASALGRAGPERAAHSVGEAPGAPAQRRVRDAGLRKEALRHP
eukprot:3555995-Pleurochrysis_carterae.AAC.3